MNTIPTTLFVPVSISGSLGFSCRVYLEHGTSKSSQAFCITFISCVHTQHDAILFYPFQFRSQTPCALKINLLCFPAGDSRGSFLFPCVLLAIIVRCPHAAFFVAVFLVILMIHGFTSFSHFSLHIHFCLLATIMTPFCALTCELLKFPLMYLLDSVGAISLLSGSSGSLLLPSSLLPSSVNLNYSLSSDQLLSSPLQAKSTFKGMTVIGAAYGEVRCPYHERWIKEKDTRKSSGVDEEEAAREHAIRFVPTTRTWSNSTFESGLDKKRSSEERSQLADAMYQR